MDPIKRILKRIVKRPSRKTPRPQIHTDEMRRAREKKEWVIFEARELVRRSIFF